MSDAQAAKVERLDLLSVPEAAKLLGKSDHCIYKWIRKGKIRALRIGELGNFMIPRKDLMDALEYKPEQAQE